MAFDPSMEVVKPDAISTGSGQVVDTAEPYTFLDPCPNCGARPHDAPEGCNPDGKPRHNFPHCYKCGHRPGVNNVTDLATLRRDFEEFRQFQEAKQLNA